MKKGEPTNDMEEKVFPPLTDIEQKAATRLSNNDRSHFARFLINQKDNKYIPYLIYEMASDHFDLRKVTEYGLSHLPQRRPVDPLRAISSYFFFLSELNEIPELIRDFFIDTSIWCDGIHEGSIYSDAFTPHTIYKENIEPFLLCEKERLKEKQNKLPATSDFSGAE